MHDGKRQKRTRVALPNYAFVVPDGITLRHLGPVMAFSHGDNYYLGNRSGLEWILDQYKEKKPKDPTIAAKFNTYRFEDYKEKVIDLLSRVTRVSVETMEIVNEMKAAKRE